MGVVLGTYYGFRGFVLFIGQVRLVFIFVGLPTYGYKIYRGTRQRVIVILRGLCVASAMGLYGVVNIRVSVIANGGVFGVRGRVYGQ